MNSGKLPKGFLVDGKYQVFLFIKKGKNAENYRVKGPDGKLYFLKLFDLVKLQNQAFNESGNILEIDCVKALNQKNTVTYKDSSEIIFEGKKYCYLVLDFIAGETLAEQITREPISTIYDVRLIGSGILDGLQYLHSLRDPIIHNEITLQNVMMDQSGETPKPVIIDFGYARRFHQGRTKFLGEGLNLNFLASECFHGLCSPQSDLYSVGALLYQLIFGIAPWSKEISQFHKERTKEVEIIIKERQKPLLFPNLEFEMVDFDESILKVIEKALNQDPDQRFQSAEEFKKALNGEIILTSQKDSGAEANFKNISKDDKKEKIGFGFSSIAGMHSLKEQLKSDVINVIENPEEYKAHGLGIPNGILLYGPPGCGKTYFAEKFAEEAGYTFMKIISSDLASIYVHGTQEKIGKVFKEAREKAPTILYFDELDAMTPNRENLHNQSQSGEVNEFLSQLDNIGDSGVFVIGSTNKPDLIDKAILRAGRLEKWFFIPPPDLEARKAMFELFLKDRPLDFGIDYTKLANLTENYVSSDIKLLIDEASRKTIRDGAKRISMEILEYVIKAQRPTVSISELKKYELLRKKIEEGLEDWFNVRAPIGFKTS